MLMQDPSGFDKDFVIREFRWVTNYLGFDISTMDIVMNFFQNFEHVPFHMNIISLILFILSSFIIMMQLHFPRVDSKKWVLVAVNPLYETINFFDPTSSTAKQNQEELMRNMVHFPPIF
jgi:hypothetical protein